MKTPSRPVLRACRLLAAALILAAAPCGALAAQAPDSDGDGLPDAWEVLFGLDPANPADAAADPDGDGLASLQEYGYGTSPVAADTDGDRLRDGWEVANGFDPLSGMSPDLLGWWRFDEASGSNVVDRCGLGHDAVIRAPAHVVRASAAPVGGALRFDGVSDPADPVPVGHVVAAGLAGQALSNAFTVTAWVRPGSFADFAPVLSKVSAPDAWDDGFALYALGDGSFGAFVRDFGDVSNRLLCAVASATNAWRHLCLVYDGSRSVLYLDGVPVAEAVHASGAVANAAPLVIGSLVGAGGTRPWHGDIADVRVYGAALSGDEVLSLLETYADPDGDGLSNLQEQDFGSDPRLADTDGDGLSDALELAHRTNPRLADTDGDGLSDAFEVARGTNPRAADTDGDGLSDADEIRLGRDPLAAGASAAATFLRVHTPLE